MEVPPVRFADIFAMCCIFSLGSFKLAQRDKKLSASGRARTSAPPRKHERPSSSSLA